MGNGILPGYAISQNSAKMGVALQVYTLNHVILVVKCKSWQQTIYNDQCSISQNSAKMGVALQVYTLNHVILVVKCKSWQQTIYNDQCSI